MEWNVHGCSAICFSTSERQACADKYACILVSAGLALRSTKAYRTAAMHIPLRLLHSRWPVLAAEMWQSEAGMSCSNRQELTGRRSAFAGSGPAAETGLQSPANRAGHCQPHLGSEIRSSFDIGSVMQHTAYPRTNLLGRAVAVA